MSSKILAAAVFAAVLQHLAAGQETAKLVAVAGQPEDRFGHSVAVDGSRAVVGAVFNGDVGAAYVFDVGTGVQTQQLVASDGAAWDWFGASVAIDGDLVLVGAPLDDDLGRETGAAYLFDAASGAQLSKLVPPGPMPAFGGLHHGFSVALSNGVAAVSSYTDEDNGLVSGSVHLYDVSNPGAPVQVSKVLAPDGAEGDQFGWSVALDGALLLVGATGEDEAAPEAGAAYLFDVSNPALPVRLAKLRAADGATGDVFGSSVALDGTTALVGAPWKNEAGVEAGAAYLFDLTVPTAPVQRKLLPADGAMFDHFGTSVALAAGLAFVGSPEDDDNGPRSGSVYQFETAFGLQVAKLLPSDGVAGDNFGVSLAAAAAAAVVGSPGNTDGPPVPGAAYLFDSGPPPFVSTCYGEGCPCGNDDPDAGCANSTGQGGLLAASGTSSVAADDLVLSGSQLPPGQSAIVYMGDDLMDNAFFDGRQCALGNTFRFLGSSQSTGAGGTFSHTGFVAAAGGLIQPGDLRLFQVWHRDVAPGPCGTGANLTNAVGVFFGP